MRLKRMKVKITKKRSDPEVKERETEIKKQKTGHHKVKKMETELMKQKKSHPDVKKNECEKKRVIAMLKIR